MNNSNPIKSLKNDTPPFIKKHSNHPNFLEPVLNDFV